MGKPLKFLNPQIMLHISYKSPCFILKFAFVDSVKMSYTSFTTEDLWDLINNCGSKPSIKDVTAALSLHLQVKENDKLVAVVTKELKKYSKAAKKLKEAYSRDRTVAKPVTSEKLFDDGDLEATNGGVPMEVDESASSSYRSRRSFGSLQPKQQARETQMIVESLKDFVNKQNEKRSDSEEEFTITNLLGYLLKKENHLTDKKVAEVGRRLMNNQPLEEASKNPTTEIGIDKMDAVVMIHDIDLSKEGARKMKRYWPGGKFPGTTTILETRKQLRPEIKPLSSFEDNPNTDLSGSAVSYKQLIKDTTASVFDVIHHRDPTLLQTFSSFNMVFKDGADGAGSQSVMRKAAMFNTPEHVYQHAIVPLRMEGVSSNGDLTEIWRNDAPNSALWCRPQALIRGKEDRGLLEYDFTYAEKEQEELCKEPVMITSSRNPGLAGLVKMHIVDSMKDLKLKKSLSGCGGAACLLCMSKKGDWMKEECVNKGFLMERTREVVDEIYAEIVRNEEEGVKMSSDERKGVTQEPITKSNQVHITVTHSLINCTNWFLKLLARLECQYYKWVERSGPYGEHIRKATERVQAKIATTEGLGMRIGMVNKSNENTGGSTTGNDGRDFFIAKADKVRELILEIVPEKHRSDIAELHKNLGAILIIICCTQKIDVSVFRELTRATNLLILRKFPWAEINFTLHGVLSHSADLIELNDGYGLGALSEEALEANNKFIRIYASTRARKTSADDQCMDVMARLLERSDPFLRELSKRFQKKPSLKKRRSTTTTAELNPVMAELDDIVERMIIKQ